MTTDRLTDILGAEHFTFAFPTLAAATDHACRRMAEGREAVAFTDDEGRHIAAWGLRRG